MAVEGRSKARLLAAAGMVVCCAAVVGSPDWTPARTVEGVRVEYRPTASGFHVHRARTSVCADLDTLALFVADTTQFRDWIPFTRSARLLDESGGSYVYYVRSASPWPAKDRDMIYRISRQETGDEGLRLVIDGLPDYQPPVRDAARIQEASGEWLLRPFDGGVQVSYELYVDVGSAPAYFANRRLATVVGQTLANLTARFPCAA